MFNQYGRQNGCGCYKGHRRSSAPKVNCEPITLAVQPECGLTPLDMVLETEDNCALPCQFVTYTLTITNNCTSALVNPILNIDLDDALCYRRNSLTVDGTAKENVRCLQNLQLDNLEPQATVTITWQARVMTTQRYIVSHAILNYEINCCCSRRCYKTISNGSVVQVCQSCCGGGNTTSTTETEA